MDMEERYFADAAKSRMNYEYDQYLRGQGPSEDSAGASGETQDTPAVTGKQVYLCAEASDRVSVSALLDALDRYDAQAAFYCTLEFAEENGDLLRRMSATGQAIGLVADGAESRSVTEQLEESNRLLHRAASVKTRLAWIENASASDLAEAEAAGFCPLSSGSGPGGIPPQRDGRRRHPAAAGKQPVRSGIGLAGGRDQPRGAGSLPGGYGRGGRAVPRYDGDGVLSRKRKDFTENSTYAVSGGYNKKGRAARAQRHMKREGPLWAATSWL